MDLFLGVATPDIDKSLQRFVNKLVAKLSLQLMAFFPASKLTIYHVVALIILTFATLIIVILHFQNSPRKPPFLWLRGMLAVCQGLMWVINPHDINYEQAAATATLTAPDTFQKAMYGLLEDLKMSCVLVYLDDITVLSQPFQEHLSHLWLVFN